MILLRALGACLAAAARIRSHLFWRALYALLRSRVVTAAAAAAVGVAERLRGRGTGDFVLSRFSERFVTSGWPRQDRGWVNLDKTQCEHIRSALGRIATNARLWPGLLSFTARS